MSNDNDRVSIGEWVVGGMVAPHQGSMTRPRLPQKSSLTATGTSHVIGYCPPAVMLEVLRRMGALDRPGLPAEPAAGMVRCRAAVRVDREGERYAVLGGSMYTKDQDLVDDLEDDVGQRVSFVTFDAPKPEPATEIVGVEVDHG
jgi:hypothetical protein